jgi:N-formylmaleamate deformylase
MLEYTEGNVKINGINIHYYRTGGDKPAFLLLHGASDNGLCWTPVAEVLAGRYDVIMPDAQGHGHSDRIDPSFSFINHAHQIAGLIRELNITKPIIMGHSMGAGTTVNIAVNYPEIPKAIILEDPGWQDREPTGPEEEEARAREREAFMKTFAGYGARTREELMTECRENNPLWSEAEIVLWAESKLQFDLAIFSSMQIDRPHYTELVPRITCPTLLITSDGGLVTPESARKAASLWKAEQPLQWVEIKGAGHNIRREQFSTFCDTLNNFLAGL